jgi:hypothetical protein
MVILPTTFVNGLPDCPLFFFAGPVLGGGDWQYHAYKEMGKLFPKFVSVIPCSYPPSHPLYKERLAGDEGFFGSLRRFERWYLEQAAFSAKQGCVIFWLPRESETSPRTDGSPYARDTYGEIGEWRGQLIHNRRFRIVIGGEKNFPGLDVIAENYTLACNERFKIYPTLEETLQAAIRMVN